MRQPLTGGALPGGPLPGEARTKGALPGKALTGRVALVTGASRGLGAAVARKLAELGAHVVLTARTQGGLEDTGDAITAAGGAATLLPLDLREPDTLEAIGPSIYARFGRLDILVHAAGVLGKLTPVGHATAADRMEALSVNTLAVWRLIQSCEAPVRQAGAGRAVFVTDARARAPSAYWAAHGATKVAAEHLVLSWAAEVTQTPLRVNLFDPGPMRTRMRGLAFPGEDPATLPTPEAAAAALCALCLADEDRNGVLVRHR